RRFRANAGRFLAARHSPSPLSESAHNTIGTRPIGRSGTCAKHSHPLSPRFDVRLTIGVGPEAANSRCGAKSPSGNQPTLSVLRALSAGFLRSKGSRPWGNRKGWPRPPTDSITESWRAGLGALRATAGCRARDRSYLTSLYGTRAGPIISTREAPREVLAKRVEFKPVFSRQHAADRPLSPAQGRTPRLPSTTSPAPAGV